jgi:hypothetical protein
VPLYVELVAGWVIEEADEEAASTPVPAFPALAVLGASLLLGALPAAVGLLILLGLAG